VVEGREGDLIALAKQPEALADDCARAKVLITLYPAPADCAARVFHRDSLRSRGGVTLSRTAEGYSITASESEGVDRPWAPSSVAAASVRARSTGTAERGTRPVDATPPEAEREAAD
jgi:competence protein ComEC